MRLSLKQAIIPRAFNHWNRKIGFGNRVEIQVLQWLGKYPVAAANVLIPGQNPRLESASNWIERRIGSLQENPYQFSEIFNRAIASTKRKINCLFLALSSIAGLTILFDHLKDSSPINYSDIPIFAIPTVLTLASGHFLKNIYIRAEISRYRAETTKAMLSKSEQRMKATLDALPDLLFEVDRRGRIFNFHSSDTEKLFASPDVFLGDTVDQILPKEAADIIMRAIGEAVETGRHAGATYPLRIADGTRWFELSISAMGDPKASDGRLIVLIRDITESKRIKESLVDSEERYRALFHANPDAVVVIGLDGNIIDCNDEAAIFASQPQDKLINMPFMGLNLLIEKDSPKFAAMMIRFLKAEKVDPIEVTTYENRHFVCFPSIVLKESKPYAIRIIFRDVTRQREIEASIKEHELAANVLKRLQDIVHDGRNIIAPIMATTSAGRLEAKAAQVQLKMIQDRFEELQSVGATFFSPIIEALRGVIKFIVNVQEDYRTIQKASKTLSKMMDDLLDVSKDIRISPYPAPINIAIKKAIDVAKTKLKLSNIIVVSSMADKIHSICHDETAIQRVIINLIGNSIDAMSPVNKGKIHVTVEEEKVDAPLPTIFGDMPRGRYVTIEVSDTGTGIPVEIQERMFDFYASTKGERGSGIGLAYVKKAVQAHGGFIRVKTETDGETTGTSIKIYLPISLEETSDGETTLAAGAVERAAPAAVAAEGTKMGISRILVVDDEEIIRAVMLRALELSGFEVLVAQDSEQALELLGGQDFDLIITDFQLPGIGGKRWLERIRKENSGIPIFCMSGYELDHSETGGLAQAIFQKPLELDKLASRIKELDPADVGDTL
jgi:PAS domain S-box-containing protein